LRSATNQYLGEGIAPPISTQERVNILGVGVSALNLKDLAQLGLTIINPWERRGLARERCYEEMTTR
jgi:hypothetical protein